MENTGRENLHRHQPAAGKRGHATTAFLGVLLAVFTLKPCASAAEPASDPHLVKVWGGWYSCERGYILRRGECLAEAEIPPGPEVIVSDLPSAGDGARGTCPSGGCGSFVAPSYWAYSGPAYGGWSYPYYGGWSHSRRFRGGELVLVHSGPFGQTRSFAPGGFLTAPRHFHSVPQRRSYPGFAGGKLFGGGSRGVSHHPGGKGRAWR